MPSIRPISDLRNSANEISDFCKQTREPVFITRNGAGNKSLFFTWSKWQSERQSQVENGILMLSLRSEEKNVRKLYRLAEAAVRHCMIIAGHIPW